MAVYNVGVVELDTTGDVTKYVDRGAYDVPADDENLNQAGENAKDEALKSPVYRGLIAGRIMLRVKSIKLKSKADDMIVVMQSPAPGPKATNDGQYHDSGQYTIEGDEEV